MNDAQKYLARIERDAFRRPCTLARLLVSLRTDWWRWLLVTGHAVWLYWLIIHALLTRS